MVNSAVHEGVKSQIRMGCQKGRSKSDVVSEGNKGKDRGLLFVHFSVKRV